MPVVAIARLRLGTLGPGTSRHRGAATTWRGGARALIDDRISLHETIPQRLPLAHLVLPPLTVRLTHEVGVMVGRGARVLPVVTPKSVSIVTVVRLTTVGRVPIVVVVAAAIVAEVIVVASPSASLAVVAARVTVARLVSLLGNHFAATIRAVAAVESLAPSTATTSASTFVIRRNVSESEVHHIFIRVIPTTVSTMGPRRHGHGQVGDSNVAMIVDVMQTNGVAVVAPETVQGPVAGASGRWKWQVAVVGSGDVRSDAHDGQEEQAEDVPETQHAV